MTSPFRTVFDLAAVLELRELERVLHEAEVRGLRDRVSLPMLLERYPGRRGARNLRALLEAAEPVGFTRNDFEEAFVALVDAYGLRRPRMNAHLALRGRFFEIDALWEDERVAVELDSRGVHGTKKHFETDRQRDRILSPRAGGRCGSPGGSCRTNRRRSLRDLQSWRSSRAVTHTHMAGRCG